MMCGKCGKNEKATVTTAKFSFLFCGKGVIQARRAAEMDLFCL